MYLFELPQVLEPVVLESPHPYNHNQDSYTPVRIPGAASLRISFYGNTVTESGADYVRILDKSRSKTFGNFSGSTSNFPGAVRCLLVSMWLSLLYRCLSLQGTRPPLTVPGDEIIVYFHSDGSVNAWGYRITVEGVVDDSACVVVKVCARTRTSVCVCVLTPASCVMYCRAIQRFSRFVTGPLGQHPLPPQGSSTASKSHQRFRVM